MDSRGAEAHPGHSVGADALLLRARCRVPEITHRAALPRMRAPAHYAARELDVHKECMAVLRPLIATCAAGKGRGRRARLDKEAGKKAATLNILAAASAQRPCGQTSWLSLVGSGSALPLCPSDGFGMREEAGDNFVRAFVFFKFFFSFLLLDAARRLAVALRIGSSTGFRRVPPLPHFQPIKREIRRLPRASFDMPRRRRRGHHSS